MGVFITESEPTIEMLASTTPITTIVISPAIPVSTTTLTGQPTSMVTETPQTTVIRTENVQSSPVWATRLFYLGGALLAVMLGLLITMVVIIVKMNRD